MNKEINNNGYSYVDLGLPSGTLWAACNVGASKPSDFGLYFQWGDTKGYSKEQIEKENKFYLKSYKWHNDNAFTKYTNPSEALELEDDAANVNMGGDWHMPTPTQINELLDNTINAWTKSDDGVSGLMIISKKDTSKAIFIPAAGGAWNGLVVYDGKFGNVWSSMLSANSIDCGQSFGFGPGGAYVCCDYGFRDDGRSVRGVIG